MVDVVTLDGARAAFSAAQISLLRNGLRGGVVLAGDPEYDAVRRVWNGNVDRRPAMVMRCANTADGRRAASARL